MFTLPIISKKLLQNKEANLPCFKNQKQYFLLIHLDLEFVVIRKFLLKFSFSAKYLGHHLDVNADSNDLGHSNGKYMRYMPSFCIFNDSSWSESLLFWLILTYNFELLDHKLVLL